MELSIIIVNWNSAALVRQCLASLVAHCRLANTEVIVVDSGSHDGCDRMLAEHFPWVHFVQSNQNVGFARANNLGVRNSRGASLLFLNPDTVLHEDSPGILRQRLATLPGTGALGCRLLNADGSVQTSCIQSFPTLLNQLLDAEFLRRRWPRLALWGMRPLFESHEKPSIVEAVSGACLMVSRAAFLHVGGFAETYFMYGEDLDLCYRLREAGWNVAYVPATSLVHLGGGSSRQAPSTFTAFALCDSVQRFLRTHQGDGHAAAYRTLMGMSAILRLAVMGPAQLLGRRVVRHGSGSWRKWSAILRWSLGLDAPPSVRQTGGALAASS